MMEMQDHSQSRRPYRCPYRYVRWLAATAVLFVAAGCADAPGGGAEGDGGATAAPGSFPGVVPENSADAFPGTRTPGLPEAPPEPSRDYHLAELGYTTGSPRAAINLVEFSDFGCGYCRKFHEETFPTLREEYIETGKVQWKYVPIDVGAFGANARVAAEAGMCAIEQDAFPAMRDQLFDNQSEWRSARDPVSVFARYAEEEGLEVEPFRDCVTSRRHRDRVLAGTKIFHEGGGRGTPTFYVVGFGSIPGALPIGIFRQLLDTVLAAEDGAAPPGGGDAATESG